MANLPIGKKYGRKKKTRSQLSRDLHDASTPSQSSVETSSNNIETTNSGNRRINANEVPLLESIDLSLIEELANSSPDSSTGESTATDPNTSRAMGLYKYVFIIYTKT